MKALSVFKRKRAEQGVQEIKNCSQSGKREHKPETVDILDRSFQAED